MTARSGSSTGSRKISWLRKYGFGVRLASCFLFVGLASWSVRSVFEAHLIWYANGILLSYLLLASTRRWAAFLVSGFAAQFLAGALCGLSWRLNLLLTTLNVLEVLLAKILLHRRTASLPHFTDPAYLVRFVGFGVLAAPIAAGFGAAAAGILWPEIKAGSLFQWVTSDALGNAIATPLCVAILRGRFKNAFQIGNKWAYLIVLAAVTVGAHTRTGTPLMFVIYPLLALILLQLGMGWAATAIVFVAGVSGWCTFHHLGPLAYLGGMGILEPSLLLQFFIASGVFMLYSFSMVMEREAATKRRLEEIASLHALVSENSRDAIIVTDLVGHRCYGSAAASTITGWKPEDLMTAKGIELIHPDDRARAEGILRDINSSTDGAMIECRVRKEDGAYIWVEASLRIIKGDHYGKPARVLNIVRDISARKEAEQKLQVAYEAVEALAVTDALTGLANRRHFDQYLATEWRRSARDRQPLSLIMMDVDQFKHFNDTYGHVRGDGCLKQIAEACMDVVSRPGDLVARFGGEEFAVILPNTENAGAVKVAQEICDGVRFRGLQHSGTGLGVVTISLGCATLIPRFGKHTHDLIESADRALYRAKACGRNQVCNANITPYIEENIPWEVLRAAH